MSSHAPEPAGQAPPKNPTFRPGPPVLAPPTILSLDARELENAGRERLHAYIALQELIAALVEEETFWQDAEVVARRARTLTGEAQNEWQAKDREAYQLAGKYGNGRLRRAVVGRLLLVASMASDRERARRWLEVFAVEPWWTDTDDADRRGPYAPRPDYLRKVREGARCVARRGAGRCFVCGRSLAGGARSSSGRRVRREYCAEHGQDTPVAWRDAAMEQIFAEAVRVSRPPLSVDPILASLGLEDAAPAFDAVRESSELRLPLNG